MDVVGYLEQLARESGTERRETLQEMVLHVRKLESDVVFLKQRHLSLLLELDLQIGVSARCDWNGKWLLELRGK